MSPRINSFYGFVAESSSSSAKRRKLPQHDDKHNIVMSIYKSKSDSLDKGLVILNCENCQLNLIFFCDSLIFIRTINQVKVYLPTVNLLPVIRMNSQTDKLKYIVNSTVNDKTKIKHQKLKHFNSETGVTNIKIFRDCDELTL